MAKTKKRDFAFIFSEKCLIDTLEKVVHSEIVVVAMSFYLYLTWQTLISYFLCRNLCFLENETVLQVGFSC